MNADYPIVRSQRLNPLAPSGLLGWRRPVRDHRQLPEAESHQVLVYRVDGHHIVDTGQLAPDDDRVVLATHVSVVDVGEEVPVTVRLPIPSVEGSEFTVQVTFTCTVTDPVRVVSKNISAETAILTYLRRHQRLFQLGLPYSMDDVNLVRRDVGAQIRAYTEVKPPNTLGLRLTFASVEVLTPDELAEFEKKRREKQRAHRLASQEQVYTYDLASDKERYEQDIDDLRRQHEQAVDAAKRANDRVERLREQRHSHLLRGEETDFVRRDVAQLDEAIGGSALRAWIYARSAGDVDAKQLAEQVQAEEYQRLERERTDRRLEAESDRQDRRWREEQDREHAGKRLAANVQILRDLAQRGHADFLNVNLDRIIAEATGIPLEEISGAGSQYGELSGGGSGTAAAVKGEATQGPGQSAPAGRYSDGPEAREEDD